MTEENEMNEYEKEVWRKFKNDLVSNVIDNNKRQEIILNEILSLRRLIEEQTETLSGPFPGLPRLKR
ncbi:MAG: hypothetical protein ACTSRU_09035 [Candidatus Hodarchaeales archaeon]